jgi:hypothetical protein
MARKSLVQPIKDYIILPMTGEVGVGEDEFLFLSPDFLGIKRSI